MTESIAMFDPAGLTDAVALIARLLAAEPEGVDLAATAEFGWYDGTPPKVELLDDGRRVKLLSRITYHHPDGSAWPVPAEVIVDGASIPRLFWTLIGGPFEGRYRNASIVHDHYCVVKQRGWRETHRMFHKAMRCSGVGRAKAGIMFYAVHRFGRRWDSQGLALATGAAAAPTDADAVTLLRDAEAIVRHGLNEGEIEALAEARERKAASLQLDAAPAAATTTDAAALLVVPGGRGTAADVAAVAAHLGALPDYVVRLFTERGIRIIACRDRVTDFEGDLADVVPRGWERTGRTWDDVPGAYFPDRRRVVIGTVGDAAGRIVPAKASGLHGSDDLVVHEAMHGYDYELDHAPLREPGFLAALAADRAGLSAYERQAGAAGREEAFAETGAQHCVVPAVLQNRCPRLAAYWRTMPVAELGFDAAPAAAIEDAPIGLAIREADGRIRLDLRATDATGAIGHAWFALAPGEPGHAELEQELFGQLESEGPAAGSGPRTALFFG